MHNPETRPSLVTPAGLVRFARYAAVGVSTLLFDLVLLYAAVEYFGVPYVVATPIAFLVAVSCNYMLSRIFVFKRTQRGWYSGYAYFALLAVAGALLTTSLVYVLVSYLAVYYLVARVGVAGIVGMGNYLVNLYANFKVARHH